MRNKEGKISAARCVCLISVIIVLVVASGEFGEADPGKDIPTYTRIPIIQKNNQAAIKLKIHGLQLMTIDEVPEGWAYEAYKLKIDHPMHFFRFYPYPFEGDSPSVVFDVKMFGLPVKEEETAKSISEGFKAFLQKESSTKSEIELAEITIDGEQAIMLSYDKEDEQGEILRQSEITVVVNKATFYFTFEYPAALYTQYFPTIEEIFSQTKFLRNNIDYFFEKTAVR